MRVLYLCAFLTLVYSQDVPVPAGYSDGSEPEIIGGFDAPLEISQWQASLRSESRNEHFCGGSVIAKLYILTSARCATMYGIDPKDIKVVVGSTKLSSGGTAYKVESAIVHENFTQRPLKDNIALLKLASPMEFNDKVKPIQLDDQFMEPNDDCLVTGWGRDDSIRISEPDNLQMIPITVLSDNSCKKRLNRRTTLFREGFNMCSLDSNKGVCEGDFGGPVIRGDKQVGVVSLSLGCGRGYPDLHTRVSGYVKWIREHAKE